MYRSLTCPACKNSTVAPGSQTCVSFADGHAHAVSLSCDGCGWQGADLRPSSCSSARGDLVPALGMSA